jgi:hypothetical protein
MITSDITVPNIHSTEVQSSPLYPHNRASVARALLEFIVCLESLSRQVQSKDELEMMGHLVDFVKDAEKVRAEIATSLLPSARTNYDHLSYHYQSDELKRLTDFAINGNRRNWDETNEKLLRAQVSMVERWPLCDQTFRQAVENGLSAIEDHYGSQGNDEDKKSHFLALLTEARLIALKGVNLELAMDVLEQYKNWLPSERANALVRDLNQADRVFKSESIADAISHLADQNKWSRYGREAAESHYPGDIEFRRLLAQSIKVRHAIRNAEQQRAQLYSRSLVMKAALGNGATRTKPKTLKQLLTMAPQNARAWDGLPRRARSTVFRVMTRNAKGLDATPTRISRSIFAYVEGLIALAPAHFVTLEFDHPRLELLPNIQLAQVMDKLGRICAEDFKEQVSLTNDRSHQIAVMVTALVSNKSLHLHV